MREQLIKLLNEYVESFRVKKDSEKVLGVSMKNLYPILSGNRSVKLETLINLCQKAGYSITLNIQEAQ